MQNRRRHADKRRVSLLDSHLAAMRLAAYRPRTIDSRGKVLRIFQTWLGEHGATLCSATRQHCAAWIGRDHLSPATRRVYKAHLVAFYRWCVAEGEVSQDPTDRLPSIRVPPPVPHPIAAADLRRALQVAPARMRAWLLLMALCGLRCCEVAGLRPCDVDRRDDGTVMLFLRETKGGRPAWQPAHPAVLAALGALPVDLDGHWWTCGPTRVSVEVREFLHSCGVMASAHRLRHFAGTAWYAASGQDLLTTAALLRHRSVATTQGYAAVAPVRAVEVTGLVALPA